MSVSNSLSLVALVPLLAGMVACGSGTATEDGEAVYFTPDDLESRAEIPSFEVFREASRITEFEYDLFVVEGDFPIRSEIELRQYYDERFSGRRSKSAVKLTPSTGADTGQCNVATPPSNCIDDKFYEDQQLGLRYCISNDFGANKAAIRTSLAEAALAWQQVGNAWFQYVPTHDASCRTTDPVPTSVDFKVAPRATGGACSYWPFSERACVDKTLVYNVAYDFTPNTMTGVMTHELGHILGFHHEHSRADAATGLCEAYEMRYLTDWDELSIMGYPADWGGCSIGGGNVLTESDGVGLRALYGLPAAWTMTIL